MVRIFEFLLSASALVILSPVFLLLLAIGLFDTGSPLFFQVRVGRQGHEFVLVKFRTMKVDTKNVPTHLVAASSLTTFGTFLRKTKFDELPQLWNVLCGDMSLVGPRPCLPDQIELIEARRELGVLHARPGITGLGQISGVDMSTPRQLAEIDAEMMSTFNVRAYFKYIFLTLAGRGFGDRIVRKEPVRERDIG